MTPNQSHNECLNIQNAIQRSKPKIAWNSNIGILRSSSFYPFDSLGLQSFRASSTRSSARPFFQGRHGHIHDFFRIRWYFGCDFVIESFVGRSDSIWARELQFCCTPTSVLSRSSVYPASAIILHLIDISNLFGGRGGINWIPSPASVYCLR